MRLLKSVLKPSSTARELTDGERQQAQKAGQQVWSNFVQTPQRQFCSDLSLEDKDQAQLRARALVKRLIPGASIDYQSGMGLVLLTVKGTEVIFATENSVNNLCCSNTFARDDIEIPSIEKAATIYLWYTLFPERFRDRPTYVRFEPMDTAPGSYYYYQSQYSVEQERRMQELRQQAQFFQYTTTTTKSTNEPLIRYVDIRRTTL